MGIIFLIPKILFPDFWITRCKTVLGEEQSFSELAGCALFKLNFVMRTLKIFHIHNVNLSIFSLK